MHDQFASILATVQEAVLRLFGEAGRATESGPDSKVMAVIRAVINWSVARAFQSFAFQSAVERAGLKCLPELHAANDVVLCTIDLRLCTVPVAKFVHTEV